MKQQLKKLHQAHRRGSDAFTIIEVLIVLAIAGLIMAIVFLAVPALQRNQRNTSRKSDVSRVSASVNEWYANHNGQTLTAGAGNANLTEILNSAGTLSQYTMAAAGAIGANSFTIAAGTQGAMPGGTNNVNLGSMQVVTGATCNTTTGGATVTNPSNKKTAMQYLTENSSGVTPLCLDVQ